jgi:hypothetical protein
LSTTPEYLLAGVAAGAAAVVVVAVAEQPAAQEAPALVAVARALEK